MQARLLVAAPILLLVGCGGAHRAATTETTAVPVVDPPAQIAAPRRLVPTAAGQLSAPVQDVAAAQFGGGAVLLGGLTASDASTAEIVTVTRAGARRVGRLPGALDDAAAATIGAHGLYPSRDARYLYVTNRGAESISVVSFRTGRIVHTWHIPGGGSPDMGNVSADGNVLWVSGRWSRVVYAIGTKDGRLLAKIPVGAGPDGLCVWPQPGRYSLGHTGILR
jgi:DNA-binding beta-propeller fold protein YncE